MGCQIRCWHRRSSRGGAVSWLKVKAHRAQGQAELVKLQQSLGAPSGNVAYGTVDGVEGWRLERAFLLGIVSQLRSQQHKEFFKLLSALPEVGRLSSQISLQLCLFWTDTANTDHLSKVRITARADESRRLFALCFRLELCTAKGGNATLVLRGQIPSASHLALESLGNRWDILRVANEPVLGMVEVLDGLGRRVFLSCKLLQLSTTSCILLDLCNGGQSARSPYKTRMIATHLSQLIFHHPMHVAKLLLDAGLGASAIFLLL